MKWLERLHKWAVSRRNIGGLTLIAVALTVIFNGGLSDEQLVLIIIGTLIQSLLMRYRSTYGRAVSLEYMSRDRMPPPRNRFALGAFALINVAPISLIHYGFAAGLIAAVVLAYSVPLWRLMVARLTKKKIQAATAARIDEDRFEVVFYVAGPSNVGYQINQWIPVAERLGLRTCICIRRRGIFYEMLPTGLPVIYAQKARDVETLLKSGPRVVLYPANTQENVTALRYAELQHYFINHGESDKLVNQSKFLMAYDKLLVAGPLAERRLRQAGLPVRPDQVEHVGRPQVELFVERRDAPVPVKRVLYAPTWEGFVDAVDYSSVSGFGIAMLEAILKRPGVEVWLKPHPFTGLRSGGHRKALAQMQSMADRHPNLTVIDKMVPIYDAMNWCDVMVADVGSVVNDFLASGKPIVVCSTRGLGAAEFVAQNPTSAAAYLLSTPTEAGDLIGEIDAQDPMAEARATTRRESLGEFAEGSLVRFTTKVTEGVRITEAALAASTPQVPEKAAAE